MQKRLAFWVHVISFPVSLMYKRQVHADMYVHMTHVCWHTEDLETLVRSSSTPSLRNSSSDETPSSPCMKNAEPKGLQLQFPKNTLTQGQVKVDAFFLFIFFYNFQNSQVNKIDFDYLNELSITWHHIWVNDCSPTNISSGWVNWLILNFYKLTGIIWNHTNKP